MSAFLKASNNTHNINIDDSLIAVFMSAMEKFHKYFSKNDLLDIFDIDEFLKRNFYTNTYPEYKKYKIRFVKPEELSEERRNIGGYHDSDTKEIVVLDKDRYKTNPEYEFNIIEHIFIHEMIHSFTLNDYIIKNNTKNTNDRTMSREEFYTLKNFLLYQEKNHPISQYNELISKYFYDKNYLFEPLTEMLAIEISGYREFPSYAELLNLVKLTHTVFDIEFPRHFLQREMSNYYKSLSVQSFFQKLNGFSDVFDLSSELRNKNLPPMKSKEYQFTVKESIYEILFEYSADLYSKPTQTPTEFIKKQIQIYNNLPYKYFLDTKKILSETNKIYVSKLLNDKNIKSTPSRQAELLHYINQCLEYSEKIYDKDLGDNSLILSGKNQSLKLYFDDSKLIISDLHAKELSNVVRGVKFDLQNFSNATAEKTKLLAISNTEDNENNVFYEKEANKPLKITGSNFGEFEIDFNNTGLKIIKDKYTYIEHKKINRVNLQEIYNKFYMATTESLTKYKMQDLTNDNTRSM